MNPELNNIIKKQQEQILYLQKQMEQKQMEQKQMKSKIKINPYKILEIPKKHNKKMLKQSYAKKALIMHPDRGGDTNDFKLLNLSYKILLKKLEEKEVNDYADLKNNHKKQILENKDNLIFNKKINKDNFDVNVFNEVYTEHKLKDYFNDTGYGDWLKTTKIKDSVNLEGKFTNEKFNNEFEKYKEDISKNKSTKIIENPDELMSITNKDSLQLLGVGKIKNYSGNSNGLGYRDLKDAYENPTLINIKNIDISNRNKNIIHYEKDRENISHEMNKSELIKYNINLEKKKKKKIED